MNLYVLKNNTPSLNMVSREMQKGIQELYLSYDEIHNSRVLLFLCSKKIENLTIDVRDNLNSEVLKLLSKLSSTIKISIDYEPTKKTVELLSILLPDKAGSIRKAFMLKKNIMEVIS